jgi:hypothetical protein
MSRVEAAAGLDRLPWLPDEPKPQPAKRRGSVATWAAAAVLLVAGAGFWVGVRSVEQPAATAVRGSPATTTVHLPQPHPSPPQVSLPPQPQVRLAPTPQVRLAPAREVRIAGAPAPHKNKHEAPSAEKSAQAVAPEHPTAAAPPAAAHSPHFVMPAPWNPRAVAGAAGRLVQIGAFGSVHQAKRGWWSMVHDYPAMAHLPAVVRETRNSTGRTFYRFDVGTTSQAHSEVLCQCMQKVHLSCAVVGLPWKAKVER